MTSESAQTVFKSWVKTSLSPMLRDLGFTGSGLSYLLPDDDCWLQLGLQKDRYSTREAISFTVNLSVTNKVLWSLLREGHEDWLGVRPSANSEFLGQRTARLGQLLPQRADVWWSIPATATSSELITLCRELEIGVRDCAIPAFHRLATENRTSKLEDRLDALRRLEPGEARWAASSSPTWDRPNPWS